MSQTTIDTTPGIPDPGAASRAAPRTTSGNLVRHPEEITRVPDLPRWGTERRRLMVRFGYVAISVALVSVALVALGDDRWTDAAGISLVAPGAGFLFDGWPILFVLTWVLFLLAWNLWVGFGSLIHLVAVYVLSIAGSIALADGPRLGLESGTSWRWAIPLAYVGAGTYVIKHLWRVSRSRKAEIATRDERNAYLASVDPDVVEQIIRSFDPPEQRASVRDFDPVGVQVDGDVLRPPLPVEDADAALVKWLLRLSMQSIESFEGWDWGKDAVEAGALRYQVNEVGYCLAYFQANYAPAYPGLLGRAQRNVISKSQEVPVWAYWYSEEVMGNFRANPDPIVGAGFQNIMFSGFLAKHLAHYEAATHDHRYDEPGSLTFTWDDGRSWSYSYPEIARHCSDAFLSSPMGMWPCEPNQIYTACNQFGAAGVQAFGALHGSDEWERVSEHYRSALDHEWMRLNGDYHGHFNRALGLNAGALTWNDGTGPMFMDGNQVIMALGRTTAPEVAARLFLIGRNAETLRVLPVVDGVMQLPPPAQAEPEGWIAKIRTRVPTYKHFLSGAWAPLEKTGYAKSNAVMYAGIADMARQFGHPDIADAAVRGLDAANFQGLDADRPFAATLPVNSLAAKSRWGRLYRADDFVCARIPRYEGPILESAPETDVIVTYANGRDDMLCLTLEPSSAPGEFPLVFGRLAPSTRYVVEGVGSEFVTDADGGASVILPLTARTTVLIRPEGDAP